MRWGFSPGGGAKNVARRDGMGTTVLSAVEKIGRIPDYYFRPWVGNRGYCGGGGQ
ncbi:MAG: hypothetical protein ACLTZT_11530 [Butyricimonas faecalis]